MKQRHDGQETFLQAYRRLGKNSFREALYGPEHNRRGGADKETADV